MRVRHLQVLIFMALPIRMRWFWLSITLVVTLTLVAASSITVQIRSAQVASGGQLEFTIAAVKDKFIVGEPVQLKLQLVNNSDKDLSGDFYLSFKFGTLHVLITPPGQPEFLYWPASLQRAETSDFPLLPLTLKAGAKLEGKEFVSYDLKREDFAFPAAGEYQLRAEQLFDSGDPSKRVKSNAITVEVVDPQSEEDKGALQFIIDKQLKAYLTPEAALVPPPVGKTVNDQVQQLQAFLKQFPNSTYVPYVAAGLAAICQGREQELPACKAQFQQPQLSFTIKAVKDRLLVGESLKIQMSVRNETNDDLKMQFHLGFGCMDDLSVAISSDGGKTFQLYTSMAMIIGQSEFCIVPPFTLKPNEERKGEEFIGFHIVSFNPMTNELEGDFAFPKAGKYQLKMILVPRPLPGAVESNVIEIEVVEPEGKDKEALQFIVDNQLKPFLTPEAVLFHATDETVQKLQQFLGKFPDSTYTPYVKLGLDALCRERREQLPACQK